MRILTIILLFVTSNLFATNYYVSATGNDASAGTSTGTAWQSITKVNAFVFAAGDSILFKRGDTFYGGIVLKRSSLNFGAYGTGAKPLISGFSTVTSWTNTSGSIFEATVPVTIGPDGLRMVTVDGAPQAIGRYPNADAGAGGYLHYETYSGSNAITDNQLTSTPNWTGADLVVFKNNWTCERRVITNHVGGNITSTPSTYYLNDNYSANPVYSGIGGYAYFIQNDLRTLDQFGEWFFNKATNKISMHFGAEAPATYTIRVATVPVLFNIGGYNTISIRDIDFEGSMRQAILFRYTNNITVKNCDFNNIGKTAVQGFQSGNVVYENCHVNRALDCGLSIYSGNAYNNTSIINSGVSNIGLLPGMGSFYSTEDFVGIYNSANSNVYVGGCTSIYTGVDAIKFNGSNAIIENNVVKWGDSVLQDHALIYCYSDGKDATPGIEYVNGIIRNNIISHTAIGSRFISNSSTPLVSGIYLDGRRHNMEIYGNVIDSITKNAIHCNNPWNVYIHDNIMFSSGRGFSYFDWTWGSILNYHVTNNVIWSTTPTQLAQYYTNGALNNSTSTNITVKQTLDTLGYTDSNYYNNTTLTNWQVEKYDSISYTGASKGYGLLKYNFANWKTFSGYESHGVAMPNVRSDSVVLVKNETAISKTIALSGRYKDNKNTFYNSSVTLSPYSGKVLFLVSAVAPLTVSLSKTNVSCNAGSNATVTSTVSGGLTPYSYSWTGPSGFTSTSANLTGRIAGVYNLTATDAAGTQGTASVTVTQPTAIAVTTAYPPITTPGGTTTVTVTATGGTPGYTGTGNYTSQPAGQHIYTVTDANGCIAKDTITIVETVPPSKTITLTKTNANCFGGTGGVTTSVTGGTTPYTYGWTGPSGFTATTANISSIVPGTYTLIVTDAALVKDTAVAVIIQPSKIILSDSFGVITTLGGVTAVKITGVGGTGSLTGTGYYTNQPAGQHIYTVTDANGCIAKDTIVVLYQPPSFSLSFSSSNASCNGSSDGSITVTASGGISPYTYAWLPGGQTTATISSLSANNYSVTVTDANTTTATGSVNITQPSPVVANAVVSGVVNDSTSTTDVTISATGGSGTYVSGTGTFVQAAGTTVYPVTDSNGCTGGVSVTIKITNKNRVIITNIKASVINKGPL
jgi:hypothetical protein